MADKKVLVTQIRSAIGRDEKQKATIRSLGLGRIGRQRVHQLSPSTAGMLKAVRHLVTVEEAAD